MSKMTDEQEAMLHELADAVRPIVESIESSTPTTRDHYDAYMACIERLARTRPGEHRANPKTLLIIGFALCEAGANRDGVMAALRIMGVI